MWLNPRYIFTITLTLLLFSASLIVQATHISEPILNESKTKYRLGEKIIFSGWVNYDNQPTADVLLALKVTRADGSIAREATQSSDDNGQFAFEFATNNQLPGKYLVEVTSHCLAVHRSICTYKNKTLSIDIIE